MFDVSEESGDPTCPGTGPACPEWSVCRRVQRGPRPGSLGKKKLSTYARSIDEIEDIEVQLLKRVNESLWYTTQVNKSTDVDK